MVPEILLSPSAGLAQEMRGVSGVSLRALRRGDPVGRYDRVGADIVRVSRDVVAQFIGEYRHRAAPPEVCETAVIVARPAADTYPRRRVCGERGEDGGVGKREGIGGKRVGYGNRL